jgi:adenine phosphoribosyltransferase
MTLHQKIVDTIRDVPDFPKPGILFKDITPLLKDPALCRDITSEMARRLEGQQVDAIAAVESRGFLFGMMLANALNIPFIPVRKSGKLPYKTIGFEYSLEYGTAKVEIHTDAIKPGWNVLIHDDLLATGGTAAAAAELVLASGGTVAGFAFLVGLDFLKGKEYLSKYSDSIWELVSY